MAALSVAAIIVIMAVPSFRALLQNNRAATSANELVDALQSARNESVTRGVRVGLCASSNGTSCSGSTSWQSGWMIFADPNGNAGTVDAGDQVLRTFPGLQGSATLTAGQAYIDYTPNGFLCGPTTAPSCTGSVTTITFSLRVPKCTANSNRDVVVNQQGRPSTSAVSCP